MAALYTLDVESDDLTYTLETKVTVFLAPEHETWQLVEMSLAEIGMEGYLLHHASAVVVAKWLTRESLLDCRDAQALSDTVRITVTGSLTQTEDDGAGVCTGTDLGEGVGRGEGVGAGVWTGRGEGVRWGDGAGRGEGVGAGVWTGRGEGVRCGDGVGAGVCTGTGVEEGTLQ